ncbi:SDR family NAD(P)-dependent oxidoreductase [Actinoplanes sp. NPDC048988]|uniref:SDR family NAD(P)-dependent oxidoreductase n=1 Tax=Actinoplanes sp. NPDC048988 TaxID=3363901 RepID=UPI0037172EDE
MTLEGKVALVTGAGTGMGAATAELLAERGARVTLVGRRQQPLDEVAHRITAAGGEALVVRADVTDAGAMTTAVEQTVARFGALHHAVNNAGVASENADLPDLPISLWTDTIAVNLTSLFLAMRVEIPAIVAAGGGSVVNVSSVFADRGLPMRAAYSASKHGVRGLTRSAARDWAHRGVRINELQPGVIATPMLDAGAGGGEAAGIAESIPAGRIGDPREIATAVAFLLSDEASYITGAHLAVDGGFLA